MSLKNHLKESDIYIQLATKISNFITNSFSADTQNEILKNSITLNRFIKQNKKKYIKSLTYILNYNNKHLSNVESRSILTMFNSDGSSYNPNSNSIMSIEKNILLPLNHILHLAKQYFAINFKHTDIITNELFKIFVPLIKKLNKNTLRNLLLYSNQKGLNFVHYFFSIDNTPFYIDHFNTLWKNVYINSDKKYLLTRIAQDGYSFLHYAFLTRNLHLIKEAISLFTQKINNNIYLLSSAEKRTILLTHSIHNNTNFIHLAFKTKNPSIIKLGIELLQLKNSANNSILSNTNVNALLTTFPNVNYPILHSALDSGNINLVKNALKLLHDYVKPYDLRHNTNNFGKIIKCKSCYDFTFISNAFASKNFHCVKTAMEVLRSAYKKIPNPCISDEECRTILITNTFNNYNFLLQAFSSHSIEMVKEAIKFFFLTSKDDKRYILTSEDITNIITSCSTNGYNILLSAFNSCELTLVKLAIHLLLQPPREGVIISKPMLIKLLTTTTNSGFNFITQAFMSKEIDLVSRAINLLLMKDDKNNLILSEKNVYHLLMQINKCKFTFLHNTLKTKNIDIISLAFSLLNLQNISSNYIIHNQALQYLLLHNENQFKYNILHQATHTQKPKIVKKLIDFIHSRFPLHQAHNILHILLNTPNLDGHLPSSYNKSINNMLTRYKTYAVAVPTVYIINPQNYQNTNLKFHK